MLRKPIRELKVLFAAFVESLDRNYATIFKGAVFLMGVSLAGLSQTYPEITKQDYETRKIQFEVEAEVGRPITDLQCDDAGKNAAMCKLVQYQLTANKSAMKLAAFIVVVSGYGGAFLMYLSLQGYIVAALRAHKERT